MEMVDTDGDGNPDDVALSRTDRERMFDDIVNTNVGTSSNSLVRGSFNPQNGRFEI